MPMGVNHGGGAGGLIPPEFAVGDANTGCPPRFLSFFKISSARHGFVPPRFQPRSTPLRMPLKNQEQINSNRKRYVSTGRLKAARSGEVHAAVAQCLWS
jgi:hypothetical protein